MTSMWMVQNDDGRYLNWDEGEGRYEFSSFFEGQSFLKARAEDMASAIGGHLVELVPAQEPPMLSRSEVKYVQDAHERRFPIEYLHSCNVSDGDQEDVLYAYVTGRYTVEPEPTKYNVKVPHTTDGTYYTKVSAGIGTAYRAANHQETQQFTMDEIKHYGLEDCERVEINTEDSDDE